MLRRRLLVLAAVLLATGAIAAALTPRELRKGTATTPTSAAPAPPRAPGGGTAAGTAEDVRVVDASAPRPAVVRARPGQLLRLRVRATAPDEVELVGLDRFASVDSFTPARFDFFPQRGGTFPIRLVGARRDVGRLVVDAPPL
ncbi:MAG: hypothetical protein QOE65_1672 [Solirubrobacteraceae bacterium]|nr:hypothetical protein [Solirubrobacteraceae bacterium]